MIENEQDKKYKKSYEFEFDPRLRLQKTTEKK